MHRARLFVLVSLLAVQAMAQSALAADRDGNFAIKGIGIEPCSRFLQERASKSPEYEMFSGWLDGYITALNQTRDDVFDLTDWRERGLLSTFIENHCERNPDDRFIAVARALTDELQTTALRQASELVEVEAMGRSITLYRDALKRVQKTLADLGLYDGETHGRFDERTRLAILDFQRSRTDITPTGLPDQYTLHVLFGGRVGPAR